MIIRDEVESDISAIAEVTEIAFATLALPLEQETPWGVVVFHSAFSARSRRIR